MWDFFLVTLAKLVSALAQPVLRWRARAEGPRQRKRIEAMPTTPLAGAPVGARVRVAGIVEPARAPSGRGAWIVRGEDGATALVQPASAAAIWSADGVALDGVAAGDRVEVVGVARAPHPAIDRELQGGERLVFAGSEAQPLFIIRRR